MGHKTAPCGFALCAALFLAADVWAAHPLITDDADTQGKGNFQFEINGEYDHDKDDGITTTGGQANAVLTYGVSDCFDMSVGIPYRWIKQKSDDQLISSSENGFSDISVNAKWRFYQKDGVSFAIEPGLSLPSGDFEEGLGAGKVGYSFFIVGTRETGSWTFLGNIGYIRNEVDSDIEELNIWHISAAAIYALNDQWKIVGNLVAERNTEKDCDNNPVSAITGFIYSPTKDIDLDLGVKLGLTSSATDWALLAGTTFRF